MYIFIIRIDFFINFVNSFMKTLFVVKAGFKRVNGEYQQVSKYVYKKIGDNIEINGHPFLISPNQNRESNPWIWAIREENNLIPFYTEQFHTNDYPQTPVGISLRARDTAFLPIPKIILPQHKIISILLKIYYNIKLKYENIWKNKRIKYGINSESPLFTQM